MYFSGFFAFVLAGLSCSFAVKAGEVQNPFKLPDSSFNIISESYEVPNMPPVRSQGAFGTCYAFTAVTLAQHFLCQKNKWDCSKLKPEQQISDLGAIFSHYDRDSKIRYYVDGGNDWRRALDSMEYAPIITNKCAPYDQAVEQSTNLLESTKLQQAMWERIEQVRQEVNHELYVERCEECARTLATSGLRKEEEMGSLKLVQSNEVEKLRAFVMGSKAEAIQQLLMPKECYTKDTLPRTKFPPSTVFPPWEDLGASKDVDLATSIAMAKEWFKEKSRPFAMSTDVPVPCENDETKACGTDVHQFVVSGYRKVCDLNGKCIELFKLHNSWGQWWQDQYNDGWVVADHLWINQDDPVIGFSGFNY